MKKILLASAILMLCFQTIAFCQNNDNPVVNSAVAKLKTELSGRVIEKAYLQFDRGNPYYVAGDVVYFKAYVTMGEKHELSVISNLLHVDLLDKNDAILQSIAVQLNNGTGWGDFALPDSLKKGSYRVRAYTQWMRNDANPYFFDQYISVSSVNNVDKAAAVAKQSAQPATQFFPEGGNLVADLPSKVAFKAVGTDGLGINVKGVIVDNDNREVATIASGHFGMGAFSFTPDDGKKYKARLTYADGSKSTVDLPAVEAKGITLAVSNDNPAKISIEIKANRPYYKENLNKELNILIYSAGDVRTVSTKLDNSILGLDLPSNSFHTGILQVTLLSATGEPLNERLSFIQNADLLNLSVTAGKLVFAKREAVQVNLAAKTKDGSPATGSFSVAVIDASKVATDENSENSILAYLLLKSELKGYIENPSYYFANVTKETRTDLDALMLSQGYRRFAWKQLLDNNAAVTTNKFEAEKYVNIAGMLQTKAGQPLANNTIMLIEGNGASVLTQTTDQQGRFNFANMAFYSNTRFILKAPTSATGKNSVILTLDKAIAPVLPSTGNSIEAKYNSNADILASLENNQGQGTVTASNEPGGVLLKIGNDGQTKDNTARSSKIGGSGNADQVVSSGQFLPGPTLSGALNGILRGVEFSGGTPYLKSSQTVNAGSVGAEPMLVMIDGAQISDVDVIDPLGVESVEVLRGPNAGIYGVRGASGVLIITSKQINSGYTPNKETSPGIFSINPVGFYKAREFYSPAYTADQQSNAAADTRTTIFWKPDVTTDASGNATFNYFNADGAGTYRVVVEGIDNKGNLGRQVFTYKVQ